MDLYTIIVAILIALSLGCAFFSGKLALSYLRKYSIGDSVTIAMMQMTICVMLATVLFSNLSTHRLEKKVDDLQHALVVECVLSSEPNSEERKACLKRVGIGEEE